jgi:hypothetical protein
MDNSQQKILVGRIEDYYDYLCDGCKQRVCKALNLDSKNPFEANRRWFEKTTKFLKERREDKDA